MVQKAHDLTGSTNYSLSVVLRGWSGMADLEGLFIMLLYLFPILLSDTFTCGQVVHFHYEICSFSSHYLPN